MLVAVERPGHNQGVKGSRILGLNGGLVVTMKE